MLPLTAELHPRHLLYEMKLEDVWDYMSVAHFIWLLTEFSPDNVNKLYGFCHTVFGCGSKLN